MKNKEWHGLLEIQEIIHTDKYGKVLWQEKNLTNILHNTGEYLLLSTTFAGLTLPETFYFGLDSRTTLTVTGGTGGESLIYPVVEENITIANSPTGEPSIGSGYYRVSVANDVFVVVLEDNHYRANGPIVTFLGSGDGWGPVTNLFMSYVNDSSQDIILATVPLSQPIQINDGEVLNARLGLKLRTC